MLDDLAGFYNYRIVLAYAPVFARGLLTTLEVSSPAFVIAAIGGTWLAVLRGSASRWLSGSARAYAEIMRATPLLAQLYLLYFGLGPLPFIDQRLSALECGIIALGLNNAAYMGEIVRAGLSAVPFGQREAGLALGMSPRQALRLVILPQAVAHIAPAAIGQAAMLIKDSSLVSFIGVLDLTGAGMQVMNDRLMPNEGFFTTALGYLVIYALMSLLASRVAVRMGGRRRRR